jgi:hypothetical protein
MPKALSRTHRCWSTTQSLSGRWLRHSTISTTLDTYSRVLPNLQKEAVKAKEDPIRGLKGQGFHFTLALSTKV